MPDFKNWSSRKLDRLKSDMDRLFDGLCSDLGLPPVGDGTFCEGDVCFRVEDDKLEISLAIQGMESEDLNVDITERMLTVIGKHETIGPGKQRMHSFTRRLSLPCSVETDKAEIVFQHGTLIVSIPCKTTTSPREADK